MAHNIYFLHFDLTKSLTNQLDLIKLKYILIAGFHNLFHPAIRDGRKLRI